MCSLTTECVLRETKEQKVNGHVVTAKGNTLCIFKAADGSEHGTAGGADGAGKAETAPVAFFECPADIKVFEVACANIAVGCADGQMLHL